MLWEFRGVVCALWGFPGRVWGDLWRGAEWSAGAHGLCRASFGETGAGLEGKVPGVRTGPGGPARFLGLLNWSPFRPGREAWGRFPREPQTLQSRRSGAEPSGRALRGGSGRHRARPGGAGLVACARCSSWRGALRVMCPRKVWVSCRYEVFTYSRTFLMAALGGIPPAAEPSLRAGGSLTSDSSAARCARGAAAAVETQPRGDQSRGATACPEPQAGLPPPGRFY